MTTVLVRARVRRRRRQDGLEELVRRSPLDVAASELAVLAALCGGAALLAGGFGGLPALTAAAVVLAAYQAVRAGRGPGRTVAFQPVPVRPLAPGKGRPAPWRAPAGALRPGTVGLASERG